MSWLMAVGLGVICFWAAISFMDSLLRTCQNYPYIWLMEKTGLVLKFGQIRWTTARYNRIFVWLGSRRPKFLQLWFNLGAIFGLLAVVPSIGVLLVTVKNNVYPPESDDAQPILSAMLPGVNLPTREIPFYVTTLIFCIVIHELGHALAAVREEVRVLGCGLTVIGVLPAAFVDISTEQVLLIHPWRQLKIFCAGIWHNIILALLALVLLMAAPYAFSLGYAQGSGVMVQHIQENFPSGLSVGDHVTGINGCPVSDFQSWYHCLYKAAKGPQFGSCIPNSYLGNYKWNSSGLTIHTEVVVCCSPDDFKGVCFAWINPSSERQKIKSFSCLPARQLLERSTSTCISEEECDEDSSCILPALENSTRLVQVERNGREDALYICQVSELYYAVSPSNYVPRFKYFPVIIPYIVEMFLKYIISFSGALAMLNAIPCYALDGQWICSAFIELGLSGVITNRRTRNTIGTMALVLGTLLLALTVVTGLKSIL